MLGFGSIIPATHSVLIDNILSVVNVPAWLPFMAALYLLGGLMYAVRFPECLLPGTFDIWVTDYSLRSYNWWHGSVMVGSQTYDNEVGSTPGQVAVKWLLLGLLPANR